jgi:Na+/melibiose symporter-like transporter
VGAALLIATALVTWFYPLDRERFNRVRRLLDRRRAKRALRKAAESAP